MDIVDSGGINAEGYVFYDKGSYSDGWRYLQATPADLRVIDGVPTVDSTADGYSSASTGYVYGYYRTSGGASNTTVGTNTNIGTGKANTNALVTKMGESAYSSSSGPSKTANYAARLCYILEYAGYDDWFLPSSYELNLMYTNLKQAGLGGFADALYWSSSEADDNYAWTQKFSVGSQFNYGRGFEYMVRPVRAF